MDLIGVKGDFVRNHIDKLLEDKAFKSKAEIARLLDVKPQYLNAILNGQRNVSDKFFSKFTKTFNITQNDLDYIKQKETEIIKVEEKGANYYKTIGFYYPNVDASAGLNFNTNNDELEKIPVSIPYWGDNLKFINVFGDSMYPKFQSGEIIGIKEIEYTYLTYGNTYVVIMQNGDVHLKFVKKGKDEEHVILASENNFYEDRQFHIKHIRKFYQVKGVISRLTM